MQNLTPETFWMVIGLTYLLFHGMTLLGAIQELDIDKFDIARLNILNATVFILVLYIMWFPMMWFFIASTIGDGVQALIKDLTKCYSCASMPNKCKGKKA